jgi:hypothetical protein
LSTATKPTAWTEGGTIAALRDKFPAPAFALLAGVANATGGRHSRQADALAFSCWPSRGLHLIGFEVKVSRSDWLREMKDPAKAETICRFCDYWFVACGQAGIVRADELPPTWGLLEPKGDKLVTVKEAPKLEPAPIDRNFLAAIFRRLAESVDNRPAVEAEVSRAVYKAQQEARKAADERWEQVTKRSEDELASLRRALSDFQEASGIRIDRYTGGKQLGDAARVITSGGLKHLHSQFKRLGTEAEGIAAIVKRCIEATEPEVPTS